MKKIVLLLTILAAAFSTAVVSAQVTDTIVSLAPSNRNVLLEVFTSIGCSHCSDGDRLSNELAAAHPGRVNVINIHEGGYASNTYTTEFGTALRQQSNLGGYPQGTINRHLFSGTATAMGRGDWTGKANQILAMSSPVNIAAEGTLDWATRTLNIRVQLYYTTNQTVTSNSLNIAIVQDNVLGPQNGSDYYNPTQMVGDLYNHNDMLRHLITGQWGDTISTIVQGTLVERTYQYVIPEQLGYPNPIDAVLENLRFIAFVCEGHQEVLTSVEIPIQMFDSGQMAQQTFTVANGTVGNNKSPINTFNTSNFYTRNQVIYPASMLSEIEGDADISAITFHLKSLPFSAWTGVYQMKLGTVNRSQFTSSNFYSTDTLPALFTGTVSVAPDSTMTINLDEPFTYHGGNLLLEFVTATTGSITYVNFKGVSSPNGSLYHVHSNVNGDHSSGTVENFIPKTTFTFAWQDIYRPQNLVVSDITGSSALVSWQQGHSTIPFPYEVSYRVAGASDWTVAATTTGKSQLLTGLQQQTDYEVRVRTLCGDGCSDSATTAFTTECSGGYTAPITFGNFSNPSSSSTHIPVSMGLDKFSYSQQIFMADEIDGAKRINGLSLQYFYSESATRNIDIYMGHTNKSGFSANNDWVSPDNLTLVYSGVLTFDNTGEDYEFWIPFDVTFDYNGTDNLVVAFYDYSNGTLSTGSRFYTHYKNSACNYLVSSSEINLANPSGHTNGILSYRNNIRIRGNCISDGCDRANVAVTDITGTSALLHFTAGNSSTGFELQFKNAADSAFTTLTATGNTYQLTGLEQNTAYSVRIRSLCTNSQSSWKEVTFTTPVNYYPRLYVSVGGTGDGGSWATATGDLNYALNMASAIRNAFETSPDVWVAEGVYYGDSVSASAFTMMSGINVYGGFAGNETELSQRDLNAHPSILDGQHSQRVLNQPSVFTVRTLWDGFTIRNGYTTGNGGGAYLQNKANLRNCIFQGNTAKNGGGAYAYSSDETGLGVIIIEDCQFIGNVATASGSSNAYGGGGLYASYTIATRCTFTHNSANNKSGGGVYVYYSSQFFSALSNCLIANNTASTGGGVWNYSSLTKIENTTIVHNSSSGNGAGINTGGIWQISNSIIWGNRTTSGAVSNIYTNSSSPLNCKYSAVEGGYDGEGNITLTSENTGTSPFGPRFVHPSYAVGASDTTGNADWRLTYGSPCVNRGNTLLMSSLDTTDLAGNVRIQHDTVDMGCYESDYNTSPMPQFGNIIYVTEQGAGTQFGNSWENATASIADAQALAQSNNAVVWVAKGTYYGNTASDNAFDMVAGVNVYGGFAGNEPAGYDLSLRDFETNASILDGQNARRVLNQPSNFTEATAVTWDGFTIQHGRTSGYGAGVYLQQYSTLSHCIVQNNNVYYYSSTGESVSSFGAGVFSYITLSNGIRPNLISDCIIRNNSFENNSSLTGRGAGLCIKGTKLIRTEISHNTSPSYGGGIYSYADDTLSNCLIHSNSASFGGGIYINGGSNIYTNCDIVGNTVSSNGGGIYSNNNTFPEFTNCIIWGNRKSGNPNNSNPNIVCTYSAVEGGYDGVGNIALASENTGSDPLCPRFKRPSSFTGASNTPDYSDWRLAFGSPCVNSGTNTEADTTDLDGNNRIQKGIIDMGCYESAYDSIPPQYGNIIYVTKHGAGGQIGNSWADAISSIEEAQALAREHNAVVWVAKGTYYGNTTSYNAFYMVPGVSVYGGFAGNEPADYDLSLRDFETNTTILDGLHSRRVLDQPTNFTADSAVTWDGFTIQNGSTSGYGAGVYMMQYSTLSHCIVQNNNVYYYSSSGSSVSSYGAGVFSYITLSDGMRPNIISDCIIRNNSFEDHTSLTGRGAGLCIKGTKIIRTEISYNTCPRSYGGGLFSYADDTLTNCLVYNNSARYGAGLYINGANNCFTNCDFVGNTVPSNGYGGGFYNSSVSPVFTNCILWGNKKDNNVSDFVYSSGNPPTLTYCAVTGGFSGTGNLNLAIANDGNNDTLLYVRLVDPANGDFQLQPNSACIDAGNSGAVDSDRDFYGNPRLNGTVDIGCYEANSNITETIEATACNSYTWNGTTYISSGEYVQTFTLADGIDSVVTLHLTVNYSTHNVKTETACESFVWHGQTYTTSGTYTYAYTNADGCESMDTLHLTVNPVFSTPVTATICEGSSYSFFDTTLATAGTYTHTLQSVHGCDSVIMLTLTVNQ
ncbi:MAG: Omp28-related outer membrane protein, partial [Bacteroidales bacterium]|nr:Omp28-related outer membrane protein [Bacteroidales bacterium]